MRAGLYAGRPHLARAGLPDARQAAEFMTGSTLPGHAALSL